MIIKIKVVSNLKIRQVKSKLRNVAENALRNVIVAIARDAKKDSPWLTGNNSRSIDFNVEGQTGSVYSTSGYGGYLETGTSKMGARPYMKPALDRHIGKLSGEVKAQLK